MIVRNFILFFEEKEGTSPLMRLLDNFSQISVVHQINSAGWEPFDRHNCGPMSLGDLAQCLESIYGADPAGMENLNRIYMKTAIKPLEAINKSASVGFKMRFVPPGGTLPFASRLPILGDFVQARYLQYQASRGRFRRTMFSLLKKCGVIVFVAVRQDVFRWALSKYHGDGSGKPGHLQFDLVSGKVQREEIPRIHVDCRRLEKLIAQCERSHDRKRVLIEDLKRDGIGAYPLRYEEFMGDRQRFFGRICKRLEIPASAQEIAAALDRGTAFQKVHSDDISGYVVNHEEVSARFKDRYVAWREEAS